MPKLSEGTIDESQTGTGQLSNTLLSSIITRSVSSPDENQFKLELTPIKPINYKIE